MSCNLFISKSVYVNRDEVQYQDLIATALKCIDIDIDFCH